MSTDIHDFDSVISFSQSLSQWAVVVIGGTAALFLGNSHVRPWNMLVRLIYLLFIPAWIFLLLSTWMGVKVQRNFLALKLLQQTDPSATKIALNNHLRCQLSFMQVGLTWVGLWLGCYLFWWIFNRQMSTTSEVKE